MSDLPGFDTPELARAVEALSEAEIHELPYGAVRLALDGTVEFYSDSEARQSGHRTRPTLGRNFFLEIAPCMDSAQVRGQIERTLQRGALDLEFGTVGNFEDARRELRVRVQSAGRGGYWLFIQRA